MPLKAILNEIGNLISMRTVRCRLREVYLPKRIARKVSLLRQKINLNLKFKEIGACKKSFQLVRCRRWKQNGEAFCRAIKKNLFIWKRLWPECLTSYIHT